MKLYIDLKLQLEIVSIVIISRISPTSAFGTISVIKPEMIKIKNLKPLIVNIKL